MKPKRYAEIAFKAIVTYTNNDYLNKGHKLNKDLPMDGDFTYDIAKEFLQLLDVWQGNK